MSVLKEAIMRRTCSSLNPLIKAAKEGDIPTVQTLLAQGVNVNAKAPASKWDRTALMEAAQRGDTDIVQLLLDAGTDVNVKSVHGHSALTYASEKRYTEIIQLLKKAGVRE